MSGLRCGEDLTQRTKPSSQARTLPQLAYTRTLLLTILFLTSTSPLLHGLSHSPYKLKSTHLKKIATKMKPSSYQQSLSAHLITSLCIFTAHLTKMLYIFTPRNHLLPFMNPTCALTCPSTGSLHLLFPLPGTLFS